MSRIEIPEQLLPALGPEMKMDVHLVDVKLADGKKLQNLVVRGGRYITGRDTDTNGEGNLSFSAKDIQAVRRHKPSWWPLW
jgi:hypothetical protein